eukprot:3488158-Prymnesium_polylepis.1
MPPPAMRIMSTTAVAPQAPNESVALPLDAETSSCGVVTTCTLADVKKMVALVALASSVAITCVAALAPSALG